MSTEIQIKVVPGSSRDELVGWLGDALKVKVSAPPEKGKANKSIIALISKSLGISKNQISIVSGTTSALKTLAITGLSKSELLDLIEAKLSGDAQK